MSVSPFHSVTLNVVDSITEAERFFRWLGERRPLLACDTETRGLDASTPNFVRLVQFGDGETGWTISAHRWLGVIEEAFRRIREPLVFHNQPFDVRALHTLDISLTQETHDTYIMSHLLENDGRHGLKPLSEAEWGWEATIGQRLLDLGMKKGKWDWSTVPESFMPYTAYAAMDCILTARLAEKMLPLVPKEIYERERAVQDIYTRVGMRGMAVDQEFAANLREEWIVEAAILLDDLKSIGIKNPKSSKQISEAFGEEFGWEPEDFTGSGKPKMDAEVLNTLVAECGYPADAAQKIIKYKRLEKWVTTYLDKFVAAPILYPTINTLRARTGRMSITNPPIQTIPKEAIMRNCILPRRNEALWAMDYTAQELCMLVHFSRDTKLAGALSRKDMHSYVASLTYGMSEDEVSKEQRGIAKNVQYARLYGAGPAKMALMSGASEADILQFLKRYDAEFPEVAKTIRKVEETGRKRLLDSGRATIRTWGGRTLSAGKDKNGNEKIYALLNYLIQGSCADLLKVKTLALAAEGLDEFIIAPIHDEIVFSFPKGEEGAELAKTAKEILDERDAFFIPIIVTSKGPAKNLGELV